MSDDEYGVWVQLELFRVELAEGFQMLADTCDQIADQSGSSQPQ